MSSERALWVEFCTYKAAKYAVLSWHYSRLMPRGKSVKFGVWEHGHFVGALIFGDGLLGSTHEFMGIPKLLIAELERVALQEHKAPVSQILSIAIRKLKDFCPGLRLLVSFADTGQDHHGGIYQATNWIYTGQTTPAKMWRHKVTGVIHHDRNVSKTGYVSHFGQLKRRFREDECDPIPGDPKHRYLYPLDRGMRRQIKHLAQPYPKRAEEVSTVTRSASSRERQVQSLRSAPDPMKT